MVSESAYILPKASVFIVDCDLLLLIIDVKLLTTLRIPGLIKFGPLDENEATMGALESKAALVLCIVPTGLLQNTDSEHSA